MPPKRYNVHLDNVFEGPMDLLVYLIKKNEVDIYDIPIALITDQYLGYMKWMKSMNIDLAADFLLMAATLAQIKSRMLLPATSIQEDEELEDPRDEITGPLLEYLQIKSAAETLAGRDLLGEQLFTRSQSLNTEVSGGTSDLVHIGLFELIDAFQKILAKASPQERLDFTPDQLTVKERIRQIAELLDQKGNARFDTLFEDNSSKEKLIITFLAILEMAKLGLVRIAQHAPNGIIRIFYQ